MTDYDRYPESPQEGVDPTMGGYLQNANPHLDPDAGPVDYEQPPSFGTFEREDVAPVSPAMPAPGWQTSGHAPIDPPAYEPLDYEVPAPPNDPDAQYSDIGQQVPEPPMTFDAGDWGEPPIESAGGWGSELPVEPDQSGGTDHSYDSNFGDYETAGPDEVSAPSWEDTSWDMPADEPIPQPAAPAAKSGGLGASAFFIGFLALAIVLIAGAAFYAFAVADRAPAGPETPEEAVAAMLEALAAEDALGVAESILPSERESLIDPTLALVDELTRIGLIEAGTDLNKVSGLDVTTAGLTMEIAEVDDHIRWVTLNGGSISVVGTSGDLPMSDLQMTGDLDNTVDLAAEPFSFAVVSEDGSWYPSIWYTLAETLRRDSDLPLPTISRQPVGSSTPGEAAARFVDAAFDMRPSEMLTAMDPVEMRAAYDYSSLFISDLDSAALEIRREIRSDGSDWNLASLDTSVTDDGDQALVSIDGFVVTGTQGLTEPFTVSLDGGCLTGDFGSETETICQGDDGFPDVAPQLRVVKRDGAWFVSGAPNLIYPYVDYLRTVETDSVESFESLIESAMNSAFENVVGSGEFTFTEVEPEISTSWVLAYTVDQFVPAGTPASELTQYLLVEELPIEFVPANAIVDLGQIAGLEASIDIPAGSILSESMMREITSGEVPGEPDPSEPTPTPAPSIAEPVEANLFPADAAWNRVDSATSAVFDINPDAREPLWVAERTDGLAIIQVTKLANSREIRALEFHSFFGWQKARNIEYPAYANSQYAVVVVGNYLVVSLDPLDDSGILLEQARYLGKQIR